MCVVWGPAARLGRAKVHAWGVQFHRFWACHAPYAPKFRGVIGACHSNSKYCVPIALQRHPPGQQPFVGGVCSGCVSGLL